MKESDLENAVRSLVDTRIKLFFSSGDTCYDRSISMDEYEEECIRIGMNLDQFELAYNLGQHLYEGESYSSVTEKATAEFQEYVWRMYRELEGTDFEIIKEKIEVIEILSKNEKEAEEYLKTAQECLSMTRKSLTVAKEKLMTYLKLD